VPIAEIADARTCQQSVDIPPAAVERPGRRADENDRLIGADLHPEVESPAVHLTDDWKLWSPLYAKTPAVDGAVWTDRNG
jgi:hypothetical protein